MKLRLLIALLLPTLAFAGVDPSTLAASDEAEPAVARAEPVVQASPPALQQPQPTPDTIELAPYRAHYEGSFDVGMSLGGEAVRELQRLEDGRWRLSVTANTLLASFSESSRLQLHGGRVRPLRYHYERRVLGETREATLDFDWNALTVLNDVNDTPWSMDIPADAHDKISYQLQLRRDIAAGATELAYAVADGGHLKTYRFEVLGEETVESPLGRYPALKVERVRDPDSQRETLIWFAPALNYAIIKLQQVEKDGKRYELRLKELEGGAAR